VWSVRDRIDGRHLALKALAVGAGSAQHEVAALVREATTLLDLSSSLGAAVPTVERFGRLADGRPFLVRELIDGESLAAWIERGGDLLGACRALHGAAVQLTMLHRAGLLHGDIKPANVIVKPDGSATLVDLGLATTWGPGGARPEGLTPRFAAPELFEGEPLTVRGEVYALGASLRDALGGCDSAAMSSESLEALKAIEKRAIARDASTRYPSVDEVGAAIAAACGFTAEPPGPRGLWTIVGTDAPLGDLVKAVEAMAIGEELAVVGPVGSGRRTLMAALAWRLALHGWPVAWLRGSFSDEALCIELATALGGSDATYEQFGQHAGLLIVEDPQGGDRTLESLRKAGARVVARRTKSRGSKLAVPSLPDRDAIAIVRRALPSLPEAVLARVVSRGEGRPGKIRAIVDAIADRAIVRAESVDVIVAHIDSSTPTRSPSGHPPPSSGSPEGNVERIREHLDAGRVADAEALLAAAHAGPRTSIFRGWIALAKGDYDAARAAAKSVDDEDVPLRAERALLRAKIESRTGAYDRAIAEADAAISLPAVESVAPAIVAEALQARGVARVYRGDDAGAIADLRRAIDVARRASAGRIEALVHSSLAIAHQRAGRPGEARKAYREAIDAAESAGDASAVATTRLNLGTLAWAEGDLAAAITEFEAAADLGRRVQKQSTVERALLNLAFVDLHLGRYARVQTTLKSLEAIEPQMTPTGRAQMLGTRAELAARTGDLDRAVDLYRDTMNAWRETGRPQDAAEVVIDEIVMRRQKGSSIVSAADDLAALERAEKDAGARAAELAPQLVLARGLVKASMGEDNGALEDLDAAARAAQEQNAKEWRWQIHAARARLLSSQGSHARARRDADEAAAILEEMASKLPRDLREVFWDEPRRRTLRQVHEATVLGRPAATPATATAMTGFAGGGATFASGPPSSLASVHGGSGMTQFVRLAEDRLARILAVNRDLACEADLERLLSRVTDQAIDLLGADRGFVLLADDADPSHPFSARTARDRRKDDPSVQFSRSIAERVLQTGEPIVANDARTDARLGEAQSVHALSIHSVACVAIPRVRGADRSPIGVLYLETRGARPGRGASGSRGVPGATMEQELPTLLAFADQVGIAIANATLVEENRRRADELAKANEQLEQARKKLDEQLARRTEQFERAKADLASTRQALRGHAGYAGYKGLVGTSGAMRKLYALVDRVKATDVPVLITGESGTGKEVVARAIHAGGERAKRPFLGVNCGAIPANLLESELFGHVKGAFTGADRERRGLFREAEGGTILLDEIGDMPLPMQAGLLRVLQEKKIRAVGSNREESVDARVICATNRDLQEMVGKNEFREDLFYRINVVAIRLPSLRERAEDVPLLVDYFLGVFAAHYRRERKNISRDAIRRLQSFHWPGNVRQLEHVLLNAFVLSDGPTIEAEDLALPDSAPRPPSLGPLPEARMPSEIPGVAPATFAAHKQSEKERILAALERSGWNRLRAAELCGIPRRTFYRRLKEYGIQGGH
jgi:transcriptional regulator with GAF, ATPase, and Fis domain/Tfp pilus assembly protein PilF